MYLAGSHDMLADALLAVPRDTVEFSAVEPLACAIHAAHQSQRPTTEPKLVLGAGFFGYLLYCYLESVGTHVTLANRTRDRLDMLKQHAASLTVAYDLARHGGQFATVFLMQARISRDDIALAITLVRDGGEIVLFGAVDPAEDAILFAARKQQHRIPRFDGQKSYFLQGTLDATRSDLKESAARLDHPSFSQKAAAIFARPLTFEQGAAHLTERGKSPRSYHKQVVALKQPSVP